MTKKCSKCKKIKEIIEFYKNVSKWDGLSSECKLCCSIDHKKHYKENSTKYKIQRKDYYYKNLEKAKESTKKWNEAHPGWKENYRLNHSFGISLEDYNQIFIEQNGCCAICGIHQSELYRKLSVDHSHKTGEVRGLLCNKCNFLLGNAGDDVEILIAAVEYLT